MRTFFFCMLVVRRCCSLASCWLVCLWSHYAAAPCSTGNMSGLDVRCEWAVWKLWLHMFRFGGDLGTGPSFGGVRVTWDRCADVYVRACVSVCVCVCMLRCECVREHVIDVIELLCAVPKCGHGCERAADWIEKCATVWNECKPYALVHQMILALNEHAFAIIALNWLCQWIFYERYIIVESVLGSFYIAARQP